jgi:hypothetical protein
MSYFVVSVPLRKEEEFVTGGGKDRGAHESGRSVELG